MVNEQAGAPCARNLRIAQRLALALAGALALVGGGGCGDSGYVLPTESSEIAPLATIKVTSVLPAGWTLPEAGVRVVGDSERAGLIFEPGEEALTITLPVPPEAAGAGRVMLRVLCDGAFGFSVVLGSYESKIARSGDTRRLWKELQFPFSAPLAGDALTTPMRIVRASSEQPVALEAIRFLP